MNMSQDVAMGFTMLFAVVGLLCWVFGTIEEFSRKFRRFCIGWAVFWATPFLLHVYLTAWLGS